MLPFKNYELLEEAYSEGITVGDLRDYYTQNNDSLKNFQYFLPDGKTFKFSNEFLNTLASKIPDVPDHQNSSNILTIDPKELKYKVSRDFSKTLGLSLSELKKLDSQIFAIGNGSIKTKGSNKGDIAEILFNFVIYFYFLEKGIIPGFYEKFKKFLGEIKISGSKISSSDTIELSKNKIISLSLKLNLKTPAIIDFLRDSKNNSEIESNVNQIIHLITSSKKGIWNDVILGITSKNYLNGTSIEVAGDGAADTKDDRSDVKIIINQPKEETKKESISIKNNNKTLTKIAISALPNVLLNLNIFNVIPNSSEMNELEKVIKILNSYKSEVKKASFSSKERMMQILDQKGYSVASLIFEIVLKHFNKFSPQERFLNFVLSPAFYFVKGMNEQVHEDIFSIIDIYKNKHIVLKSKSHYEDKSEETILNFEGKKLSFTKGPYSVMKQRINNIIMFNNNQDFFQLRYSARDLDTNPRFEIYLEILNYDCYSNILEKIE